MAAKARFSIIMPRLDLQTRRKCILLHYHHGLSPRSIKQRFEEEAVHVSLQSIYLLLRKYRLHQTYVDLSCCAVLRKIMDGMLTTIDTALSENDELTANQLRNILTGQNPHLEVSLQCHREKAHKEAG